MEISAGCSVFVSERRKMVINSCRKILTSTVVNADVGVSNETAQRKMS